MRNLSNRNKKYIFNYINNNFYKDKQQLDKYLLEIIDGIYDEETFSCCFDDFISNICDNTSSVYEDLANGLARICSESERLLNINIYYSAPYYFIKNTEFGTNSFKGNRQIYLQKLNTICSSVKENVKGLFYEKFCTLFLNDIGVEVKQTKYSNDYGIDIIGKLNVRTNLNIVSDYFLKEIYLLVQIKFYNCKVDTHVIRQIIGDSLFYKFNNVEKDLVINNKPLVLAVFSHSGFYDRAEEFAKNNNIILLDSHQIIDLLCNFNNVDKLRSIKYLNWYEHTL